MVAFEEDFVRELMAMAATKRGGTVVLNYMNPPLDDHFLRLSEVMSKAKAVNKRYKYGDLLRIFDTSRDGHDLSVVIDLYEDGSAPVIRCSGLGFPMHEVPRTDKDANDEPPGGGRHRSTERMSLYTNAFIFVVSEERGCVSHVRMGQWERDLSKADIQTLLHDAYAVGAQIKDAKWPVASRNAFSVVLPLVDRMTNWWSYQIFNEDIHSSMFCELGLVSQRALVEKLYRTEDVRAAARKRMEGFAQFLANEDAEGRLNAKVKEFFHEVQRRVEQDDAWQNVFGLFNTLVSLYHLATRQTKCYMLHYGPKMIGGVIYRIVGEKRDTMLLLNFPNVRPELLDYMTHFIVEVLCRRMHDCSRIQWQIVPVLVRLAQPQIDSLGAVSDDTLKEKCDTKLSHLANHEEFSCSVESYFPPSHLRQK